MIALFNKNIVRILTVFSLSPGSRFNRETLRKKALLNNVSINKSISTLTNLKILSKEKNLYGLNFKNDSVKQLIELTSDNYTKLKKLPLNAYFLILDITYEISRIRNIGEVYLFGSYSKLIFKDNSDIDIAIISEKPNKKDINKIISKIEKKFKKTIEIHYFTKEFYQNKKDPFVKEILQSGVKLI